MANGSSLKFLRIYDTLPPEAQKSLVDSQLGSLLKSLPKEKAKRVVSAATRLQKRYASIPDIDVKSKKKEIRTLLNDLRRDNTRFFLKDRSNRTEIHAEVIDTLACWIEQIWRVVYEHNVHFVKAHNALLYIANLILEIRDISGHGGGHHPVSVKIKSTSGKLIKRFSYSNIQSMDKVLLWMWRELFVSMSASGGRQARKKISEMLVDIEDTFGWKSLAKVLHGGYNALAWALDEDEDDIDDDNDEGSILSDDMINKQRHHLRTLVISYLRTLFELNPSPNLYISIIELSDEPELTSIELLDTLSDIATSNSSAFASALTIYASEGDASEIVQLLDTHAHLLRPQDASSYQAAVVTMAEDEMLDKGGSWRRWCWRHRRRGWDTTPTSSDSLYSDDMISMKTTRTPMKVARSVSGAWVWGGMGLLDMDPDDPDLDDVREELRPRLKERFEDYCTTLITPSSGCPNSRPLIARTVKNELLTTLDDFEVCEGKEPVGHSGVRGLTTFTPSPSIKRREVGMDKGREDDLK
ncbi:hypothetical protein GYMLUDRAFT_252249 [Collybiopsis luxurians FD-317 M1]|uniref:Unplaced genomic scaffold GYMLUscaffold_121, whole genome shotgun sequence n=1 Tax=Collybiopsis luxurians FD-317 M1 TaxID=944289 RepID=A0A0D0C0R4_9AGAR|nr:hypothetical protein GYMLUDRAFT_252249 [Collybiopsis luxurians FD-317 M1]